MNAVSFCPVLSCFVHFSLFKHALMTEMASMLPVISFMDDMAVLRCQKSQDVYYSNPVQHNSLIKMSLIQICRNRITPLCRHNNSYVEWKMKKWSVLCLHLLSSFFTLIHLPGLFFLKFMHVYLIVKIVNSSSARHTLNFNRLYLGES